ncbi:MAG: tetratricopeptide repeat protein [Thermoplasmata archaeon]|nr:tetratricopeptide repeat protein [Thermoplasmata archaeon]
MNLDELKKIDVTTSMKATADAIRGAIEMLSFEVKSGKECSLKDKEILEVITTKLKEVEEEFYRPLDDPTIFEYLQGIAATASQIELDNYCQDQMNLLKANDLHYEGYTALYYGDCIEATRLLGEAYKTYPNHPLAKIDLDKAQKRLDKADGELTKAEAAIEKNPDKAVNWLKKAGTLVTMGRLEEALSVFDKAIELEPDNPDMLAKKGAALEGLGRWKEAVPLFEKALSIKPKSQIAKKGMNLAKFIGGLDIEI